MEIIVNARRQEKTQFIRVKNKNESRLCTSVLSMESVRNREKVKKRGGTTSRHAALDNSILEILDEVKLSVPTQKLLLEFFLPLFSLYMIQMWCWRKSYYAYLHIKHTKKS